MFITILKLGLGHDQLACLHTREDNNTNQLTHDYMMFTIAYTVGGGYDVHHNDGDKLSNCHIKNKMVLSYTTLTFIMDKHENMRP